VPRKRTLRKIHVYTGLISALLGVYLWLEPKWRRLQKKATGD
jgi:hypothetical protein